MLNKRGSFLVQLDIILLGIVFLFLLFNTGGLESISQRIHSFNIFGNDKDVGIPECEPNETINEAEIQSDQGNKEQIIGIPEANPSQEKTPSVGIPENEPAQEPSEENLSVKQELNFITPENNTKEPTLGIQATSITDCANLTTAGETYTLQNNISNYTTCIFISDDNITLDCNGYSITGNMTPSSNGIDAEGVTNITIKNCNVYNFTTGIFLSSVSNSTFSNINIKNNTDGLTLNINIIGNTFFDITLTEAGDTGLSLNFCDSNNFSNITLFRNSIGAYIQVSAHNLFSDIFAFNNTNEAMRLYANANYNNLSNLVLINNTRGLYIQNSFNNTASNIYASYNQYGVYFSSARQDFLYNVTAINNQYGIYATDSRSSIYSNITANNNTYQGIYILNDRNSSFYNITSTNNNVGIDLSFEVNSTFSNMVLINNSYGLYVEAGTSFNTFSDALITGGSSSYGISCDSSPNNTFSDIALNNNYIGIDLSCSNTTLYNITMSNNSNFGIIFSLDTERNTIFNLTLANSGTGIYFDTSTLNKISSGFITNCTYGIRITTDSNFNSVSNMTLINNSYGAYIFGSGNNTLYNNFFNNTINARDDSANFWNVSYSCISGSRRNIIGGDCLGGNYWSDYIGIDNGSSGRLRGDSIGDTNLPWNSTNNITFKGDYLPLTNNALRFCEDILNFTTTLSGDLKNSSGGTFCPEDGLHIGVDNITLDCDDFNIFGNGTIFSTSYGINVSGRNNIIVKNCNLYNFSSGLYVYRSANCSFSNILQESGGAGIYFSTNSNNNSLFNLTTKYNANHGLYLSSSSYNLVYNLTTLYNFNGFTLSGGNYNNISNVISTNNSRGLLLTSSIRNIFSDMLMNNPGSDGITLISNSNNNTITNSTFLNNTNGISVEATGGYNNLIFNNKFINNTENAVDSFGNQWNTSYFCAEGSGQNIVGGDCIGGNFWSDYNGSDDGSGIYPYNASGDGIGDTNLPYNSTDNISIGGDYLPLILSTGGWVNISYPEGYYTPLVGGRTAANNFMDTFNITFFGLDASQFRTLECIIYQGNNEYFVLNATLPEAAINSTFALNYTITDSDNFNVDVSSNYDNLPWEIVNCSLKAGSNIIYWNDSSYATENYTRSSNKRIFVHNSTWTRFGADAYDGQRATNCYLSETRGGYYFNNTARCSFNDLNFVANYEAGGKHEGNCHNGLNDDGDAYVLDSTDPDCLTLPYSFAFYNQTHKMFAQAGFYFNPFNKDKNSVYFWGALVLIAILVSLIFSIYMHKDLAKFLNLMLVILLPCIALLGFVINTNLASADTCSGNLCDGYVNIGGAYNLYYTYTRYADDGGNFKILLYSRSPFTTALSGSNTIDRKISGFNSNVVDVSYYNYSSPVINYQISEKTSTSGWLLAASGQNGRDAVVMIFNLSTLSGTDALTLEADQDAFSLKQFTDQFSYTKSAGYLNMQENETSGQCSDSLDNDLDSLFNCKDKDCNNTAGPTSGFYSFYSGAITYNNSNAYYNSSTGDCNYASEWMCNDTYDNDADGAEDCRDSDCDNAFGQPAGTALCNFNREVNCTDIFDNDLRDSYDCNITTGGASSNAEYDCASYCRTNLIINSTETNSSCFDGKDNDLDAWIASGNYGYARNGTGAGIDCAWSTDYPDYDCNQTVNEVTNKTCELFKEYSCSDNFDNDFDYGKSGSNSFASWTDTFNNYTFANGADCSDYNCFNVNSSGGRYNDSGKLYDCPINEFSFVNDAGSPNYYSDSLNAVTCGDGIDNDLDGLVDCADSDCAGKTKPNGDTCYTSEFNDTVGNSFQLCADGIDNDGNGLIDFEDPSCDKQFGYCGQGPTNENISFLSCFDGIDNDNDSLTDYADSDCIGRVMNYSGSKWESTESTCNDGQDNDHDGNIDCADSNCAGSTGPSGETCGAEATAPFCSDGYDNDGDGLIDCAETGCNTYCGYATVRTGSYPGAIPNWVEYNWDNSIYMRFQSRLYISTNLTAEVRGVDTYTGSYLQTMGSGTNPSYYFPYNGSQCSLQQASSTFSFSDRSLYYVAVQSDGSTLSTFRYNITCSVNDTPTSAKTLAAYVGAQKQGGATVQGDKNSYTTKSYENFAPDAPNAIIVEAMSIAAEQVNVSYGDIIHFKINVSDDATFISNIYQCYVKSNVSSFYSTSYTATNCDNAQSSAMTDDLTVNITSYAKDNSDNNGPESNRILSVNVMPEFTSFTLKSVKLNTYGDTSIPYYNATHNQLWFSASARTALSGSFGGNNLTVEIINETDDIVSNWNISAMAYNNVSFSNVTTLPSLSDGKYYLRLRISDEDSNSVYSDLRIFYICNGFTSSGDDWNCSEADFDEDGFTDAVTSPVYAPLSCDNCLKYYNPTQVDSNGDGIGDVCEFNTPPEMLEVLVNSSNGQNLANESLTCWAKATDFNEDNVSYNGTWLKNNEEYQNFSTYPKNYTSNVLLNLSTLSSSALTTGENWSCKVRAYDGINYSRYLDSNNVTILSAPALCGDAVCITGETCSTCPADCGACSTGPSGGGGGGGGGGGAPTYVNASAIVWTATFPVTTGEFDSGYSKELFPLQRLNVTVDNVDHFVGVYTVNESFADLIIESNLQQARMIVGEEKEFDVTSDGYYDIYVKLNNIIKYSASLFRANITAMAVHEPVPVVEQPQQCTSDSDCAEGSACQNGACTEIEVEEEFETGNNLLIFAILLTLTVIIVAFVVWYYIKHKEDSLNAA